MKKLLFLFVLFSFSYAETLTQEDIKRMLPGAVNISPELTNGGIYVSYVPNPEFPSMAIERSIYFDDKNLILNGDIYFIRNSLRYLSKNKKALPNFRSLIVFKKDGQNFVCSVERTKNPDYPYALKCVKDNIHTCDYFIKEGIPCVCY